MGKKQTWKIHTAYTRQICVRVPGLIWDRLHRYAQETGDSMTDIVSRALDETLPTYTSTREEAQRDE